MMKRFILCGTAGVVLAVSPAYAETPTDTAWVQAGIFRPSFTSNVQVSVPNAPIDGTDISLEGDLGLARKKTVANIEAGVRLSDRIRLEGGYFSLKRDGEQTLSRDIRWEDAVYPVDTRVDAGFSSDVYRVALGYSLLKSATAELGVRVGAHVTRFDMFIEGNAAVEGQAVAQKREQKDMTVPLPNLGVFAHYTLTNTVTLHGSANFFEMKIDDKKGRLVDVSAGLSARVTPHIGIGARYRYVDYWLRVRSDDWRGKVDYSFKGPAVFLEAAF